MLNQGTAFPKSYHGVLIFLQIVSCLSDGDRKPARKTEHVITGCFYRSCVPQHANDSEGINTVPLSFILLFLFVAPSFPNSIHSLLAISLLGNFLPTVYSVSTSFSIYFSIRIIPSSHHSLYSR